MSNILVFSVLLQHVQHCSMGILVLSGNQEFTAHFGTSLEFLQIITQLLLTKAYCLVSLKLFAVHFHFNYDE